MNSIRSNQPSHAQRIVDDGGFAQHLAMLTASHSEWNGRIAYYRLEFQPVILIQASANVRIHWCSIALFS